MKTKFRELLKKNKNSANKSPKGFLRFNQKKVSFEAGRIMLERIEALLKSNENFAFETTLSTKSYKQKLIQGKASFFWLPTIEMAVNRVAIRVSEGGHDIPEDIIVRRYSRGIENLFKIFIP